MTPRHPIFHHGIASYLLDLGRSILREMCCELSVRSCGGSPCPEYGRFWREVRASIEISRWKP